MDADYETNLEESSTCAFCHVSLDNNDLTILDSISVCGDCKFLLLEDLEIPSPDVYSRRIPLSTRSYNSSDSIESMFSQLINLARQTHHPQAFDHDYQSFEGDRTIRSLQHTTPNGSHGWGRLFSDTESDRESELNVNFRRYSDYGVSDVSLGDYGESDTDIDPMNAGLYRWNSEEEDDSEWEEVDNEISNTLESLRGGVSNNWRGRFLSPEVEAIFPVGIHERISQVGESGYYDDDEGFENLLESLVDTESSVRGAPPASVSFINKLPRVTVDEEGSDSMACAICKDSFVVGVVVNQLPCFHLFHPSCILPWLRSRNTCPVCRHEVPTDDRDYEARKRNEARLRGIVVDEPVRFDSGGGRDFGRSRWFFLAAPIVGIVGITLMMCFGGGKGWRVRVSQRRESSQRRWSFF